MLSPKSVSFTAAPRERLVNMMFCGVCVCACACCVGREQARLSVPWGKQGLPVAKGWRCSWAPLIPPLKNNKLRAQLIALRLHGTTCLPPLA